MSHNTANIKFHNVVELKDLVTGEILERKCNAIHPQNLAHVIALGLAGTTNTELSSIVQVQLGNGGTYNDTAGNILYNKPNTSGVGASLYNSTFTISDFNSNTGNDTIIASDNLLVDASGNPIPPTSLVTVQLLIPNNLPSADPTVQFPTDASLANMPANPVSNGYVYDFDELGCFAMVSNNGVLTPLLLTHIIFNPIAKTQNREIQLTYSLTISVS